MNRLFPLLVILALALPSAAESNDAASKAQVLFSQGKYKEGRDTINAAMRDKNLSSLERTQLYAAMADFNYEYTGNFKTAASFYNRILKSNVDANQDTKVKARERIAALDALKKEFLEQDKALKDISMKSYRQIPLEETEENIAQLKSLALQNPDYYKIAQVHFFTGYNQEKTNNYGDAYKSYQKAIELRPAMGFFLPITRMDTVLVKWRRQQVSTTTWAIAGILLLIIALSYYLSRPWKWIGLRHVIVGILMIALWWGVFNISHMWLASRYVVPADINSNPIAAPKYLSAAPDSYGSDVAGYLFEYGLVGVVGLYIFALGSSRLKCKRLVFCANSIIGLLLLSTLTTIFYLRHCDEKSEFISKDQGIMHYPSSTMYFYSSEPDACFLTNPQAYPNPEINNTTPEMKEWLLRHGKFDTPPEVEGSTNQ